MSRLLTPYDYGLVGMVTVVTSFVSLFNDLGLSMATVQREKINHEQVSTLFWVNVTLGIISAITAIGISPILAQLYNEPRLVNITLALSIGIIIGGLGVQHTALLKRQMNYNALGLNDFLSQFLGITAAILTALLGLGYWALVIFPIITVSSNSLGAWFFCGWRPGLPKWNSEIRLMLTFGSNLTGFSLINYFARNLDNILIGSYWGPKALGLYSKAYQLLLLPIQQINAPIAAVAIPSLSRLHNDPQKFRDYYLKAVSIITLVTIPLTVILFAIAQPMIEVLLGNQWKETGEIFQLLILSGIFQTVCSTSGWIYIAMNRSKQMFRWGLIACSFIMLSFWVGLPYGPTGVASCYSAMMLLQTWPCLYFATRNTIITVKDIWDTVQHQIISVLVSLLVYYIARVFIMQSLSYWSTITSCTLVIISIYLFMMLFLFKKKGYYLSILSAFRK